MRESEYLHAVAGRAFVKLFTLFSMIFFANLIIVLLMIFSQKLFTMFATIFLSAMTTTTTKSKEE